MSVFDILYVRPGGAESREFVQEAVETTLTPASAVTDELRRNTYDCVLWEADTADDLAGLDELFDTHPSLPVLLVASDGEDDVDQRALAAGADGAVQYAAESGPAELISRRLQAIVGGQSPDSNGTQSIASEQDLRALVEEYEMMLGTVSDMVYTLDENYYFMTVTGAAEELTGYTTDELEGAHLSLLLSDADIEQGLEHRQQVIDGEIEIGSIELEVNRKDGTTCPVEFRYRRLPSEDEFRGTAGVVRDVSARRQRERKIATQRDELEELNRINAVIRDVDQALVGARTRADIGRAVCKRLAAADPYQFAMIGQFSAVDRFEVTTWAGIGEEYVNEAFPLTGDEARESPAAEVQETVEPVVIEDLSAEPRVADRDLVSDQEFVAGMGLPIRFENQVYGILVVYADRPDAFGQRERDVMTELGETVGHAIEAVERRERETVLEALHRTTSELLHIETKSEVAEHVLAVSREVLQFEGVGVFLFDAESNVLQPAAVTDELLAYYGMTPVFGPDVDDSIVWQTFLQSETQVYDDIRTSDRRVNEDTDARSALFVPLGDHGVFVAASSEIGIFDEGTQHLVGLLASTTEAALDRVESETNLSVREQELREQNRTLVRLNRINEIIREVDQSLVRATSREEIEATVCERLTANDRFRFAWIGDVPPDRDALVPRSWAGDDGSEETYLDRISLVPDPDGEPSCRTAATDEVTSVDNVATTLAGNVWAREALGLGFQSIVSVPLRYENARYGVLTVYADEPAAVDEMATDVLAELGETVAYNINVVETKRGILADRITELEIRVPSPDTFLTHVAALADRPVTCLEITPQTGSGKTLLFKLSDAPVSDVLKLADESVAVQDIRHVTGKDEDVFRATISGSTVGNQVVEYGGIPHEIRATAEETIVLVELPHHLDVRVFIDRLDEAYPGTELLSRHERDRGTRTRSEFLADLEESLTERQLEVLRTAYEAGFFESPRENTGQEVAELLGVSQPTVQHHLRTGQRRLLRQLFGDTEQ